MLCCFYIFIYTDLYYYRLLYKHNSIYIYIIIQNDVYMYMICIYIYMYIYICICICICICHICHYMSISSELERCTRLMLKSLAFCFVYKQRINTAGFVSLKLLTWSICKPLLHCSKSHTFSCLERSCLHFENSEQGLADMTVGFY